MTSVSMFIMILCIGLEAIYKQRLNTTVTRRWSLSQTNMLSATGGTLVMLSQADACVLAELCSFVFFCLFPLRTYRMRYIKWNQL